MTPVSQSKRNLRTTLFWLLPVLVPLMFASRPEPPVFHGGGQAAGGVAQHCVQPPTTTTMSKDFYRAYQKLAVTQQSNESGLNAKVLIDDVPLAFGMKSENRSSTFDLTSLTTNDAMQIVQKELADRKVAMIAWCGYAMCQQGGNEVAIQALTGVCSLANGDNAGGATQFSARPISTQLVFDNDSTRSIKICLRLSSQSGVRTTAKAAINFQTDGIVMGFPIGSTQDSIELSSDAPTQLTATLTRPEAISDAYVEFGLISSGGPTQRVHFHLAPSQESLLPNASISCGKVTPRLYVLATNHNNGSRDRNFETSGIDLTPDVTVTRSKADSFGAGEGGGDASLDSRCTQIIQGEQKRAVTDLALRGTVHAATGNGFAGTGFHPGGGAGIFPSWESKMSLPGLEGQFWSTKVSLGNHLIATAKRAVCTVTINGPSVNSITAAIGEDKDATFQNVEPGDYQILLDCTGPDMNIGFPYTRAQAIALWSGAPGEVAKQITVSARIDARKQGGK